MSVSNIQLKKVGLSEVWIISKILLQGRGFKGSAFPTVSGWEFRSGLVGGRVCVGGGVCACVCVCVFGVSH